MIGFIGFKNQMVKEILTSALLETPLGQMRVISDKKQLYLLEFVDKKSLDREIAVLCSNTNSSVISGVTAPIDSIKTELAGYFAGTLREFKTPYCFLGTPFQKQVWSRLVCIQFGQTQTYQELAKSIGNPNACRAVGTANGANQLAILIPCHRVIKGTGELGGYAGGLARKQLLIEHEKRVVLK